MKKFEVSDVDVIIIVDSLEDDYLKGLKSQEFSDAFFEEREFSGLPVSLNYNLKDALFDEKLFTSTTNSNYNWNIITLKHNSEFLYGIDIRDALPEVEYSEEDYDDLLGRGMYHLDKSFKLEEKNNDVKKAKMQFSKSILKFSYYICATNDRNFKKTSVSEINGKIMKLKEDNIASKRVVRFLREMFNFRKNGEFDEEFKKLRYKYVLEILGLLKAGALHKKMGYNEFLKFLDKTFNGLMFLKNRIKQIKVKSEVARRNYSS